MRYSGDGTLLAVVCDGMAKGVIVVDAADGSLRQELVSTGPLVRHCVAWSADDQILAVGDQHAGHVRLRHRRDDVFTAGRTFAPPPSADEPDRDVPEDLALSPDGTLLAAAYTYGDVHVWGIESGLHLCRLRGAQESLGSVVFVDDHRLAAAGGDVDAGPPVHLWTINAG
ncbi:WD40 repeat domain-containing protein [Actinomadura sp. NPDC047616]|uniref:WD40 repeat domain-containing protein n=1 Tax=Actinomadura sp. NPDC047616 TaxID=3155914 RepID=UPI0033D629C4